MPSNHFISQNSLLHRQFSPRNNTQSMIRNFCFVFLLYSLKKISFFNSRQIAREKVLFICVWHCLNIVFMLSVSLCYLNVWPNLVCQFAKGDYVHMWLLYHWNFTILNCIKLEICVCEITALFSINFSVDDDTVGWAVKKGHKSTNNIAI